MTITEMRNKRKSLLKRWMGSWTLIKPRMAHYPQKMIKPTKPWKMESELTNEIHRMERREAIEAELEKPVRQANH